jgi:hypothetical protein
LAFFVPFGVRGITYSIHHHAGPFRDLVIRNVHIHHLVWGVLLLLGVGYLWLAQVGLGIGESSRRASTLMAMLYGICAALTLDEFALWLNLEDVYWTRKGRQSIDATILFGSLLLIGIHGWSFLSGVARDAGLVGPYQMASANCAGPCMYGNAVADFRRPRRSGSRQSMASRPAPFFSSRVLHGRHSERTVTQDGIGSIDGEDGR